MLCSHVSSSSLLNQGLDGGTHDIVLLFEHPLVMLQDLGIVEHLVVGSKVVQFSNQFAFLFFGLHPLLCYIAGNPKVFGFHKYNLWVN